MELWQQPSTSKSSFTSIIFNDLDEDIRRLQKKKPNGYYQASAHSSKNSLAEAMPDSSLRPGVSTVQFEQLRNTCIAVSELTPKVDDLRSEIASDGPLRNHYDRLEEASNLQNVELVVEMLRRKVNDLHRRIIMRKLAISELQEANRLELEKLKNLSDEKKFTYEDLSERKASITAAEKQSNVLKEVILSKRRSRIQELVNIYDIQIDNGSFSLTNSNRRCCAHADLIAGIHLPRRYTLLDHTENETSAALGHVVNMLNCLTYILDIPLPYPAVFAGSHSFVIDPKRNNKRFPLHGMRSKIERTLLDTAVELLGTDIVHLRAHCGFITMDSGAVLKNFKELCDWLLGAGPSLMQLERPFNSIRSPAAIVGRRQNCPVDTEEVDKLVHTLDVTNLDFESKRNRNYTIGEEVDDDLDSSVHSANSFEDEVQS